MIYRERKERLLGPESLFEGERIFFEPGFVVYRYAMTTPVDLAGIHLPAGGYTYGFYWEDRPYNLYFWFDDQDRPLALYFNVSDGTRVGEEEVSWRDLVVDVLYPVDAGELGPPQVLDLQEGNDVLQQEGLQGYVAHAMEAILQEAPRLYRWALSFIAVIWSGDTGVENPKEAEGR
ncbi:MAG: DUF402 domain-containing protein [Bacillota bacterium]|nr:DUF402 domain-containing protein [Bacillota bacterium]